MRRNVWTWMVAGLLCAGFSAEARGLLVDPAALPAEAKRTLAAEIAAARKQDPEAFEHVRKIAAEVEGYDARKRGRMAPMTAVFKRMGQRALWPMVELIAFDGTYPTQVASARLALDVGLVEAAGMRRDARLAPVWTAIIDGQESRREVVRSAVEALGKLDTDEAAQKLVALSRADGMRREMALWAMGHCRRLAVARALADALDARPDAALAKRIAQSLADVGNAWAWKTSAVKARSEEGAVRQTAAEALVRAYAAYDGQVRQAASNALMVVDAPATPALIDAARRGADPATREALDALAARFARNPAR